MVVVGENLVHGSFRNNQINRGVSVNGGGEQSSNEIHPID